MRGDAGSVIVCAQFLTEGDNGMSNKVISMAFGALAFIAFLAGTTQGCGGGSSATDVCNRACDKAGMCHPELGSGFAAQCKMSCGQNTAGTGGSQNTCGGMTAAQAA